MSKAYTGHQEAYKRTTKAQRSQIVKDSKADDRPVEVHWDFKALCEGRGAPDVQVKEFSPTWLTTINETARNALIFIMEDYYALDRMYWEIPVRPGAIETKIVSKPANPQHFKARTLGLQCAIHNVYPWTDPPMRKAEDSQQAFDKKMDKMLDSHKKPMTRFEELVEDVMDGLAHFDQRKDEKGRVQLIDGFWISENGIWRNLKHPTVIDGRSLAIKNRDGKWETVDHPEKYIQEMWDKVQNGPRPMKSPQLQSLNVPTQKSAGQKYPAEFQREIGGHLVNCL